MYEHSSIECFGRMPPNGRIRIDAFCSINFMCSKECSHLNCMLWVVDDNSIESVIGNLVCIDVKRMVGGGQHSILAKNRNADMTIRHSFIIIVLELIYSIDFHFNLLRRVLAKCYYMHLSLLILLLQSSNDQLRWFKHRTFPVSKYNLNIDVIIRLIVGFLTRFPRAMTPNAYFRQCRFANGYWKALFHSFIVDNFLFSRSNGGDFAIRCYEIATNWQKCNTFKSWRENSYFRGKNEMIVEFSFFILPYSYISMIGKYSNL